MNNFYDNPEKFELKVVGDIDWDQQPYAFNLMVVFQRLDDGTFVYGEDVRCSCPTPFEGQTTDDLTKIETLASFRKHCDERAGRYTRDADVVELIERLHKAGLR